MKISRRNRITGEYSTHEKIRFPLRPDACAHTLGIKGLVTAGQDNFCGGFAGALLGGMLGAGEVMGSQVGVWAGAVVAGMRFVENFKI